MALTKITGQVVDTTTDLVVGVTTVGGGVSAVDGFFSGIVTFSQGVSIGGTLTYEDVTNIDSVGLITARNGIVVGSGITLSKDGDVFFTGIATGNGSGLTNIDTDLVNDTSPQLGGNLDVNTKNIVFGDSGGSTDDRLTFGAGTDLSIYHDENNSYIQDSGTGQLRILSNQLLIQNAAGDANQIICTESGAVDLHHNGDKKLETTANGVTITGNQNFADNGYAYFGAGNDMGLYSDGSGGFIKSDDLTIGSFTGGETYIDATLNGAVELYHDDVKTAYTKATGFEIKGGNTSDQTELQIIGNEGQDASILLGADDGDDNADYWRMYSQASDNAFTLKNYAAGSYETSIRAVGNGAVELYHDNSKKLETTSSGVTVTGTVTDSIGSMRRLGTSNEGSSRALATSDTGKFLRINAGSVALSVPADTFTAGDMITFFNVSSGDMTVTSSAVTVYNSADGDTGNTRTIAAKGMATLLCTANNEFVISGSQLT